MKRAVFVVLLTLVTLAAILAFKNNGTSNSTSVSQAQTGTSATNLPQRPKVKGNKVELIIGQSDAPATIVEYADFKCSSCNQFHQGAAKQLRKNYVEPGKLKIVFRSFPNKGPDSGRALVGAYCANAQGKFTQYHDAVFDYMWNTYYQRGDYRWEIENVLTEKLLIEKAKSVGIDEASFSKCIASTDQDINIENDLVMAADDEAQGTPTFKINGQKVVGPQPYSVFKTLVDIQLR